MFLLPVNPREWLTKDHLAYFVSDLVDSFDLKEFVKAYKNTPTGQPPYHPAMMLKILVYAYSTGVFSTRVIARKIDEDIAFRMLAAGERPDFRTIAVFRKKHLSALSKLFAQVLKLAKASGLIKLGVIAIDGTKIKANASRHKALSYGRMDDVEARLRKKVKDILDEAEAIDAAEDELYGDDKTGDELPEELRDPVNRIKKIKDLRERIEREEKEKTGKEDARPKAKEQRSLTDGDSRIMKMSDKSFQYAYNCQAAVCGDPAKGEPQIIVATRLSNQASDNPQLKAVIEKVEENTGQLPKKLLADAGYFSSENLNHCKDKQIDAFIPPNKQKHSQSGPCPRGRIPRDISEADRMRRKLKTKCGKRLYDKRKVMPEPVFGEQKGVRGFRQFLLRGKENVAAEWDFLCTTSNILKLFRYAALPKLGWAKTR
jgi:transposase